LLLTEAPTCIIVHSMNKNAQKTNAELSEFQLHQFQALITRIYQCCQERMHYQSERFGLPDAELRCLMHFGEEKYCTPKGLARKMNVVKSRISRIVEGLESKSLIHRTQDPEDSRVSLLSLTLKGKKKIDEIKAFNEYIHSALLKNVSTDQRAIFLSTLESLKISMELTRDLME